MFKTQRFQPFQVTSTPLSVKHFTSHKVPFLFLGCFGVFWGTQAIPVTVPGMMFYHCMKESMFPNFSKRYCSMVHATNFDTPSYVREKGHIPGHNFEFSTPIRLSAYHYPSHMHLYLTSIAYVNHLGWGPCIHGHHHHSVNKHNRQKRCGVWYWCTNKEPFTSAPLLIKWRMISVSINTHVASFRRAVWHWPCMKLQYRQLPS